MIFIGKPPLKKKEPKRKSEVAQALIGFDSVPPKILGRRYQLLLQRKLFGQRHYVSAPCDLLARLPCMHMDVLCFGVDGEVVWEFLPNERLT